ncbi:MAG: HPP family protein [Gemmataceae bacterium]
MGSSVQTKSLVRLVLNAETAADLMTPKPVSINRNATLSDAATLLTEKNVSAVPVLDEEGRPIGVLSRTDVVRYYRDMNEKTPSMAASAMPSVQKIMTPAVLSVRPQTPAIEVVAQLLGLGNVHRLFVVDDAGVLLGVVSARDVLRKLRRQDQPY